MSDMTRIYSKEYIRTSLERSGRRGHVEVYELVSDIRS